MKLSMEVQRMAKSVLRRQLNVTWLTFTLIIMAAVCNRAGHCIFALWFLSFYLSFFFFLA